VAPQFFLIRTDRLILRRWQDSDRGAYAAMNADPEVMRYFPHTLTRAQADEHINIMERRFEQDGVGLWALEVADSGEFIGFTGLAPMPDASPGAGGTEVGWRLARAAWGHGYATEAARAALDVAFTGLGKTEIWSITSVLNEPSQAVMRRIGMTEHSHFEHPALPPDHRLRRHVAFHLDRPQPALT
jgi:RimJ/RimL family protein N-acetyltransferase